MAGRIRGGLDPVGEHDAAAVDEVLLRNEVAMQSMVLKFLARFFAGRKRGEDMRKTPRLMLRPNANPEPFRCPLCGADDIRPTGLDYFVFGTPRLVCVDCARRHAAPVLISERAAIVARYGGERGPGGYPPQLTRISIRPKGQKNFGAAGIDPAAEKKQQMPDMIR